MRRPMITFVAFHVDLARPTLRRIRERIRSVRVLSPRRALPAVFGSAERFHPGCRKVVITDRKTRLRLPPGIEVIRMDIDPADPLYARSLGWLQLLRDSDGHHVFLDSDILLNADLAPLFEREFDVGFTYRDDETWPINIGIHFAHGERRPNAVAFHEAWLEAYGARYRTRVWGGDQDSIRELLRGADFTRDDAFVHKANGFEVLMLPCALYNFSSRDNKRMPDHYPDRKVLHFKGRRKRDMLPYWKRYLRPGAG